MGVGPLKWPDGQIINDPVAMADLFAETFTYVYFFFYRYKFMG